MEQSESSQTYGSPPSAFKLIQSAVGVIATLAILGLLYVARDVLVPITVAVILSLLIAPLVRLLRRLGIGQTISVLGAVFILLLVITGVAAGLTIQIFGMSSSLPQYEETIRQKFAVIDGMTVGRLQTLKGQAARMVIRAPNGALEAPRDVLENIPAADARLPSLMAPIPVEIRPSAENPFSALQELTSSVWVPLESAGIVLVILVFVLLEHESLRDRFIRIAGGSDIRATTVALNDASERLSRFFVSQFAVNFGVAGAVGLGLAVIGLPHALIWGTLAGVLRFVPYVGIWISALFAVAIAAAVDPGWSVVIFTVALFLAIELIVGQLIEPQLYGHSTGLSPLSVVVAAIFWSWLWGPTGLLVSTPLTLCLLVAGRHIKTLSLLDVLLGDTHALTMPQRFYQRALSGDSQEIFDIAREFLKHHSFATYCDIVLIPALALARQDLDSGAIGEKQQSMVRALIVQLTDILGSDTRNLRQRPYRPSVLDTTNVGRYLRSQRERETGRYQGPLQVSEGSVFLCVGLGSQADDLTTELLVRILRQQQLDARHLFREDLEAPIPSDASPKGVSTVFVVSAYPSPERSSADSVAALARSRFSSSQLITLFFPGQLLQSTPPFEMESKADRVATSFGEAVQICLDIQKARTTVSAT